MYTSFIMLGRTHQLIGLTTGFTVYLLSNPVGYQPAMVFAVLMLSHFLALLPDVDQPLCDFWRGIPAGKYLGKISGSLLSHRNLTHSLLGAGLVWWLLTWLGAKVPAQWGLDIFLLTRVSMAAYLSHLVADMVTVEGVPLFFPMQHMFGIPPHPFQGLRIITGKWFENLIVFPAVTILFIYIVYSYWGLIHQLLL